MPSFNDFILQPATREALANMEITEPTPIQAGAIPALLAGNDVVGQSATGSGKTLAYGIPLVERLARDKRVAQALVLVPTRELAIQVSAVLSELASGRHLSTALLVGGRGYGNQLSALRYGSQIVVGTPGRVKDHLDRGSLALSQLRMCVLDEADQMLDSGFAPAVEEILATTPATRQMALFSATIPDWIETLEQKFLKDPVKVEITPAADVPNAIEQIAYQVPQEQKIAALCTLLRATQGESSLIFGKTKHGVEKLGKHLNRLGFTVGTLHSNKSQRAREEVLTAFRRGQVQTLLATNVAARGLDITGIDQVINYELPESSELFTHRVGRTGRMGRQGKAITLLVPSDVPRWRRMTRNLGQAVALQRLDIDEEAIATPPPASPEAPRTRDHARNGEQRPARDRKPFSPGHDRARPAQPEHNSHATSGMKKRQQEHFTSGAPSRPQSRPHAILMNQSPERSKGTAKDLDITRKTSSRPKSRPHVMLSASAAALSAAKGKDLDVTARAPSRPRSRQPERPYSGKPRNGRSKTMARRATARARRSAPTMTRTQRGTRLVHGRGAPHKR